MNKKLTLPFKNMTPRAWQNLAIAATITFYLIIIGSTYIYSGICDKSTMDYCAYWISGKIINQDGYAAIYNLDIQGEFQRAYFSFSRLPVAQTFAMMYPPVFVVPFQVLSLLSPTLGYIIWTFVNLVGFIFYLKFFMKKTGDNPTAPRYILLALISLPVFINFYEGQFNIWLAICAGEFIRALMEKKPFKAGLWLGGWLVKLQILILIIPFLLIQRKFKAFWGFVASSLAVFFLSVMLIGANGWRSLFDTVLTSFQGGGVSNYLGMTNWRMLGSQIALITSSTFGLIVTIVGSVITIGVTFYILRKKISPDTEKEGIAILAVFAATLLVTWHAQYHMMLLMIPSMLYLLNREQFDFKIFLVWVFAPIAIEFLDRNSLILVPYGFPVATLGSAVKLLEGLRGFTLNFVVWIWAIMTYVNSRMTVQVKPEKKPDS